MKIQGSIALVTGANRGLGLTFAQALRDAGAAKVYAAARDPSKLTLPGVTPLNLAGDVERGLRESLETNLFGTLSSAERASCL